MGIAGFKLNMAKKRKRSEAAQAVVPPKKDDVAPERPARTLLGWKDKNVVNQDDEVNENGHSPVFRNKEKVLVTCSRRIIYRYKSHTYISYCSYRVCACLDFGLVHF